MRLGTKHGAERLEAASRRAIHLHAYSYHTVKNILSAGTDRLPLELDTEANVSRLPEHDNIRGAAYYVTKEISC